MILFFLKRYSFISNELIPFFYSLPFILSQKNKFKAKKLRVHRPVDQGSKSERKRKIKRERERERERESKEKVKTKRVKKEAERQK